MKVRVGKKEERNEVWEYLLLLPGFLLLTHEDNYNTSSINSNLFPQDNWNEQHPIQLPLASQSLACTSFIKAVTCIFIYSLVIKSTNSGDKPVYIQISILVDS